jgi:ferrous iron transport protein A
MLNPMTKPTTNPNAFPLPMARPGERVQLVALQGGGQMKQRMAEMGLTPGVEVMLLQNSGGPLLLKVRETRLALGRVMAHKLSVVAIAKI